MLISYQIGSSTESRQQAINTLGHEHVRKIYWQEHFP